MNFDRLEEDAPHMLSQLRANAALLEQQLGDGRDFILGSAPGWADITAYFPVWMARTFVPPSAALFAANARMLAWETRVRDIGHGQAHRHRSQRSDSHRACSDAGGKRGSGCG